jgi:ankyrin repeat protein
VSTKQALQYKLNAIVSLLTDVLRFQYVQCQFEILQKLSSENEIHDALQKLPKGLDATYDRIFESIDPDFKERVIRSLKWLAFSMRTLTLAELSEIFIIRPSGDLAINKNDRLFSSEYILEYLSSLIVIHKRGGNNIRYTEVHLVHFSLKEYFISTRIVESTPTFAFTEVDAHISIGQSCLAYLAQFSSELTASRRAELSDLEKYVLEYWMTHLEEVPCERWPEKWAQDVALVLGFRSQSFLNQLKTQRGFDNKAIHEHIRRQSYCYTARLGLYQLTQFLICQESNANTTQEDLEVALQHAVYGENMKVMKLFLELGADVNAECGEWGSALLAAAAAKDNLSALELLVKSGANVNSPSERGRCLLTSFSKKSTQCLNFLLDNGADIDMQSGNGGTAFSDTLKRRHVDMGLFKLLLERNANVNALDGKYRTPLQTACAEVRLYDLQYYVGALLERGADPNIRGGEHGTALQAVCCHGELGGKMEENVQRAISVMQLLIDYGADVNIHGGKYGSAFNAAARCDSSAAIQIMKLLLDNGAEIDQQGDTDWGTALHVACNKGSVETVRWLLDKGIDVNAESGRFATPLQIAVVEAVREVQVFKDTKLRGPEIVKLLLKRGAQVNQQGGEYGTALHAAYANWGPGNEGQIHQLLLEHGADVNIRGGKYGTVLTAACGNYSVGVESVRLLLDCGADVSANGGEYGTALVAACTRGSKNAAEVVRLLLEQGADINAQGGKHGTALAAACKCGENPDLVALLLERGADPRRQNCLAWHVAVQSTGYKAVPILKLLLGHIDINHVHEEHGTALHAAIELWDLGAERFYNGWPQKARFLLESGADTDIVAGKFGFALQAACVAEYNLRYGGGHYSDIDHACVKTKLLLEQRPDININAQGGIFNTALQAAAYSGQTASTRLLLEKKADCNIRGGKYGSALNAAVISGWWDIVEILLKAGATPDCRLQEEPDREWLQRVREEDGRGAYERYMKFWEVQSASGGMSR